LAKLDKSLYTKEEWRKLKSERKAFKQNLNNAIIENTVTQKIKLESKDVAFVIGNGTSRSIIDLPQLKSKGTIYGCNALYRTFDPNYLIAVDTKMILEINKAGYQYKHTVWTNPNRSYVKMKGLNYFQPSKGWSSGPTALWLATQHSYKTIYILGFDYQGLDSGTKLNNIYADTANYKKSTDAATFFGNWSRQTQSVIKSSTKIKFVRVINKDSYIPKEFSKLDNLSHITVEEFKKSFGIL
jgi:hypothetical protein